MSIKYIQTTEMILKHFSIEDKIKILREIKINDSHIRTISQKLMTAEEPTKKEVYYAEVLFQYEKQRYYTSRCKEAQPISKYLI